MIVTFFLVYLKSISSIINLNYLLLFGLYGFATWLFPVFAIYAEKSENLIQFLKVSKKQIRIGVILGIIFLLIHYLTVIDIRRFPGVFLYGVTAIYVIYSCYDVSNNKYFVLMGVTILLLIAFSTMRREDLLYIVLSLSGIVFFTLKKLSKKYVFLLGSLVVLTISIIINFDFFLDIGAEIFPSKFEISSEGLLNTLTEDSRNSLIDDFKYDMKNDFMFGRGLEGKYSTPTFAPKYDLVSGGRDGIEIGFLQIILKGGILLLVVYLLVIFRALYLAFFRTNNQLTKILAFLIICHLIVMFWARVPAADANSMLLWLSVGFCFSETIRAMNDDQIKYILGNS